MLEENKTIELKEEDLEEAFGGFKGEMPSPSLYQCPNCSQICSFLPSSFERSTDARCYHCNVTTNIGYYIYLGTKEEYYGNNG